MRMARVTLTAGGSFKQLLIACTCAVVLSGCAITKPAPAPAEIHTEPHLKVQALFEKIPLNRPFPVEITVENAAPQEQIEVMLTGMPGFVPSLNEATLFADEHGAARLTLNATIEQAGYAMLIVNAEVSGERLSDTLDIVFDAPGVRTAALSVNASEEEGSSIELEEYFASLPRVSDARYVDWYEGDEELAPTSTNSADDLPETVVVEGVQYAHEDGTLTEPRWAVEHFVFDSGEGEPQPDDLSTTANEDTLQTQGCSRVSSYVTFVHTIDKGLPKEMTRALPKGTLVRVVHHNPWPFGHTLLFEGYVGSAGRFDFTLPTCIPSGSNKVDPYFLIVGDSDIGLSMHNSFFNYLTEWRTGVYWDHDSNDLRGRRIWLDVKNSLNRLQQRVWYKVSQIYNWERDASNQYSKFNVDVFYPASDYAGIATSRAAIGRMLIIVGHGIHDNVLFHEFGHEAYYRRMMGESSYNYFYRQSTQTFGTGTFPLCGKCIGHQLHKESGPDAAMIEGWADFFESMTTRVIDNNGTGGLSSIGPLLEPLRSDADKGPDVEGRVAAFLWDLWDVPSSSTDGDPISPDGDAKTRYGKIANYFVNKDVLSSFDTMWHQRIKPTLNADGLKKHCQVLKMNTLTDTPGVRDVDPECKAKL